ncbi:lipid kinase, YegS/Rv2252/BmrU family [Nocardioides alpinus]|uniref:Diacylglycerol kinase n=1 Tax=Nocardioides alpinus TaxID=748909 RepID=A0A1I1B3M7_9ACTN|nr:lipid kinase [Nocardioides alpinus]PKH41468.1 diacylglycerol kinase [Nocardioides alpinus]SFB43143.1 lipid kinase, YegS/Rv2252/BmrU family [Nocardioides alpinus]
MSEGLHTQPRLDRVAVVVNTASRTGARALPLVEAALRRTSEQVTVHPAHGGLGLLDALGAAMDEEPDLLVVGGGDGTIGCAAGLVAHTGTALGVLPLGTANDFARTLEIPSDLTAAVDTLLSGTVVDVDLGRVDGRAYLNVASLGLSVAVTRRLTPGLKRRLGRFAYPAATLAAYRGHRPFAARLELEDGTVLELRDLMQVAVGNGRHYGGGLTVSPNASIDDHLLDVYAAEHGRLRDHLSVARLLRSGHLVEHERVHHVTARRLQLVTDEPLEINLDGEVAATTPATFEVDRNALHVVVPVHSRAARMDPAPSP